MTPVLLAPHNDDEALFASFVICRDNPYVVICLRSFAQEERGGPDHWRRERETECALTELGVSAFEQWNFSDVNPNWGQVEASIMELAEKHSLAYAPMPEEEGGHIHHNRIGELALKHFSQVKFYSTYVNGRSRTQHGREVRPRPEWIARKLRALACYASQIELWPHHFLSEQREWLAE